MHGQMGKEKQPRGIRTLVAAGSHPLFLNRDMRAPALSFKLGEMCATYLNAQKATLSWYPESQRRLLHKSEEGMAGCGQWKGGQRHQGNIVKGPLVSISFQRLATPKWCQKGAVRLPLGLGSGTHLIRVD